MENVLEFLLQARKLKEVKRKGWVIRGIQDAESVAEHSFMATVMSMVLAKKAGLSSERCMKLAIVHDLAESVVGDITPSDNIPKEKKHELEREAMEKLAKLLNDGEIYDLWMEYEQRQSKEAQFVYEIDKAEMMLQAYAYEHEHNNIDFSEFWQTASKAIKDKNLLYLYLLLSGNRPKK